MQSDTELLPPQDLEAERSLLGGFLLSNQSIDDARVIVSPGCFYADAHRRICAVIFESWSALTPIDAVTLGHALERRGWLGDVGGPTYLAQLLETVPHAAHVEHYARIVREKWERRRIIEISERAIRSSQDGGREIADTVAEADSGFHAVLERSAASETVELSDALMAMYDVLDADESPGQPTGYAALDQTANGGWRDGAMYILAARPSVGKTAFACNVALNTAAAGGNVLFISIEQPRRELSERLLSIRSGVPVTAIQRRTLTTEDRDRIDTAAGELSALQIAIDDGSHRNVSQISAIARLRKRRHGLTLVIVDYLQLLSAEDPRANREQQVAGMSRGLKVLARDLGVPVIALAQLNRQIENRDNKRPRLADLRDSGSIEQDADAVMFLDRPSTYDEHANPSEARLIVAKNRNGPVGDVHLRWHPQTMRFDPVEEEEPGF